MVRELEEFDVNVIFHWFVPFPLKSFDIVVCAVLSKVRSRYPS